MKLTKIRLFSLSLRKKEHFHVYYHFTNPLLIVILVLQTFLLGFWDGETSVCSHIGIISLISHVCPRKL